MNYHYKQKSTWAKWVSVHVLHMSTEFQQFGSDNIKGVDIEFLI